MSPDISASLTKTSGMKTSSKQLFSGRVWQTVQETSQTVDARCTGLWDTDNKWRMWPIKLQTTADDFKSRGLQGKFHPVIFQQ